MGFLDGLKDKAESLGEKARERLGAVKDKAADVVDDVRDRFDSGGTTAGAATPGSPTDLIGDATYFGPGINVRAEDLAPASPAADESVAEADEGSTESSDESGDVSGVGAATAEEPEAVLAGADATAESLSLGEDSGALGPDLAAEEMPVDEDMSEATGLGDSMAGPADPFGDQSTGLENLSPTLTPPPNAPPGFEEAGFDEAGIALEDPLPSDLSPTVPDTINDAVVDTGEAGEPAADPATAGSDRLADSQDDALDAVQAESEEIRASDRP